MSKTIKHTLCIATLLAWAISIHAEAKEDCPPPPTKPTVEQIQNAARHALDHGFLWRITKDGHSSYLYGTMHIAKLEWMFPGPQVTRALQSADTVALELDFLDPDIKRRMEQGMASLHAEPLSDELTARVTKLAEQVCVPYQAVAKLPPVLQLSMLSMMLARNEGLDASYAIDMFLAALAHHDKKNVVSLETPEAQLATLQMDNPEDTAAIVKDDLDEIDKDHGHTFFERVATIWSDSDYAKMTRFPEWCECMDTAVERKMMKRLLDDRQAPLADGIDKLHQSGKKVFAAVGSLHMFGPLGLPTLMEKKGYKVERVEFK